MIRGNLLKIEGAGNDFLLGTGSWAERLADDEHLVAALCHRHRGVGADGTIALFPEAENRLRLVYRNSDGSPATFCANGTRCAARAGVDLLGLDRSLIVETGWGPIPARVDEASVTLELPPPSHGGRSLSLDAGGRTWEAEFLVLGVPHLIIHVEALADLEVGMSAPWLRRHPDLGPEGANVNYVERTGDGSLAIRSWERGVEAETLCCGSGVVAAGLLEMAELDQRSLALLPQSGDTLVVEACGEPPACASKLRGPTRVICEITPDGAWINASAE